MYKQLLTGLLLVFIAVPVFASIPAFAEIDTDSDGSISLSEAINAGISQALFAKLDQDKDNKLSAAEYELLVDSKS